MKHNFDMKKIKRFLENSWYGMVKPTSSDRICLLYTEY